MREQPIIVDLEFNGLVQYNAGDDEDLGLEDEGQSSDNGWCGISSNLEIHLNFTLDGSELRCNDGYVINPTPCYTLNLSSTLGDSNKTVWNANYADRYELLKGGKDGVDPTSNYNLYNLEMGERIEYQDVQSSLESA